MAAKPPATPRWANVGGTIVEPPSGKKDIGWEAGESPPEGYLNWFQNLDWQWLVYLQEGRFRGPIRISADDDENDTGLTGPGDLQVLGAFGAGGPAQINGVTQLEQGSVLGPWQVGTTLAVGQSGTFGTHVQGTEVCHTAIRELQLPAAAGIANMQSGGMFWDNNNKAWGNFSGTPDIVDFPIPLHARCVIHRFTVTYLTSGAGTRSFRVMRRIGASNAPIRTFSSTTTGLSTRTFNITPLFIDPGGQFTLECGILGGDAVHGVSVFYAYPFQVGVGSEVP